ncbi:MAG: hypothetical protein IJK08_01220 [Prevotella sp.]|nr:hypothetical protein [Prevotella sp.]
MQTFLSQFDRGIDALVYLYLQSVAIDGMVSQSGYAMAHQLGLYRVTLSRILRRLEQRRAISIIPSDDNGNLLQSVCIHLLLPQEKNVTLPEENVTLSEANVTPVTENITSVEANVTLQAENVTLAEANVTPHAENIMTIAVSEVPVPEQVVPIVEHTTPIEEQTVPIEEHDASAAAERPKKKNKNEKAPTTPKDKNKRKTPHPRARKSTQTLDERRQTFVDSLTPFIPTYGMEMMKAFADYWTEPNRSCSRMRFELQRTWSLPLRLATWARHDKVFAQRTVYPHRPTSNECIIQAQQWAIAESARVVREAEMSRRQQGQQHWSESIFYNENTAARQALLPF